MLGARRRGGHAPKRPHLIRVSPRADLRSEASGGSTGGESTGVPYIRDDDDASEMTMTAGQCSDDSEEAVVIKFTTRYVEMATQLNNASLG